MVTKKTSKKTELPTKTAWYSCDIPKEEIPKDVWCIVWMENDEYTRATMARMSSRLNTWLCAGSDEALEQDNVVKAYSPIFTPTGKLWMYD